MAKRLLCIRYDGTRFHGWQVQPNGVTVQETLQDAIERLTGTRADLTGCSRTDAGVHARRFYCTVEVPDTFTEQALCRSLNGVLPDDVAVLSSHTVPADFHPRYAARGKRYTYQIDNGIAPDPFLRQYAMHLRTPLDEQKLNETAQLFVGTHDFSAFCSSGTSVQDKVRTVTRSDVVRNGDTVLYTVEADGFLYNMVRIFVGTLLDVHAGRLMVEDVHAALSTGDRRFAGATAPAKGLFLDEVWYETSFD